MDDFEEEKDDWNGGWFEEDEQEEVKENEDEDEENERNQDDKEEKKVGADADVSTSPQERSRGHGRLVERFRRQTIKQFGSLVSAFELMDLNKSTQIEVHEFILALSRLGFESDEAGEIFKEIDGDSNFTISVEELLGCPAEKLKGRRSGAVKKFRQKAAEKFGSLEKAFRQIDITGDDELSRTEVELALTRLGLQEEVDVEEIFEELDLEERQKIRQADLTGDGGGLSEFEGGEEEEEKKEGRGGKGAEKEKDEEEEPQDSISEVAEEEEDWEALTDNGSERVKEESAGKEDAENEGKSDLKIQTQGEIEKEEEVTKRNEEEEGEGSDFPTPREEEDKNFPLNDPLDSFLKEVKRGDKESEGKREDISSQGQPIVETKREADENENEDEIASDFPSYTSEPRSPSPFPEEDKNEDQDQKLEQQERENTPEKPTPRDPPDRSHHTNEEEEEDGEKEAKPFEQPQSLDDDDQWFQEIQKEAEAQTSRDQEQEEEENIWERDEKSEEEGDRGDRQSQTHAEGFNETPRDPAPPGPSSLSASPMKDVSSESQQSEKPPPRSPSSGGNEGKGAASEVEDEYEEGGWEVEEAEDPLNEKTEEGGIEGRRDLRGKGKEDEKSEEEGDEWAHEEEEDIQKEDNEATSERKNVSRKDEDGEGKGFGGDQNPFLKTINSDDGKNMNNELLQQLLNKEERNVSEASEIEEEKEEEREDQKEDDNDPWALAPEDEEAEVQKRKEAASTAPQEAINSSEQEQQIATMDPSNFNTLTNQNAAPEDADMGAVWFGDEPLHAHPRAMSDEIGDSKTANTFTQKSIMAVHKAAAASQQSASSSGSVNVSSVMNPPAEQITDSQPIDVKNENLGGTVEAQRKMESSHREAEESGLPEESRAHVELPSSSPVPMQQGEASSSACRRSNTTCLPSWFLQDEPRFDQPNDVQPFAKLLNGPGPFQAYRDGGRAYRMSMQRFEYDSCLRGNQRHTEGASGFAVPSHGDDLETDPYSLNDPPASVLGPRRYDFTEDRKRRPFCPSRNLTWNSSPPLHLRFDSPKRSPGEVGNAAGAGGPVGQSPFRSRFQNESGNVEADLADFRDASISSRCRVGGPTFVSFRSVGGCASTCSPPRSVLPSRTFSQNVPVQSSRTGMGNMDGVGCGSRLAAYPGEPCGFLGADQCAPCVAAGPRGLHAPCTASGWVPTQASAGLPIGSRAAESIPRSSNGMSGNFTWKSS